MKYNKLVRDRIPEIIVRRGGIAVFHLANDEEYFKKLREKLREEVREFLKANSTDEINELVDILEVVDAICSFRNYPKKELAKMKRKKARERGAFKKRVILEWS